MKPTPSAQGDLQQTPLAHLLVYIQSQKLSGTLALWPDRDQAPGSGPDRILLQEGEILGLRPVEARDVAREHGEAAPSALAALRRLFQRRDGAYAFYEGHNLLGAGPEVVSERVNTAALLAQGLPEHPNEDVVARALSRLRGRVLRLKPDFSTEHLNLTPQVLQFLAQLQQKPLQIEELLTAPVLSPPAHAKRTVYLLALLRAFEAADGSHVSSRPSALSTKPSDGTAPYAAREAGGADSLSAPPSSARPAAPKASREATSTPPMPQGLTEPDVARWRELVELCARLDDLHHFDLLGVSLDASPSEISAAYFSSVKRFHPDRLPAALAPLAASAQVLFERLTEANETLSSPDVCAEYKRAVEGGGGTRTTDRLMRNILESAVEYQKAEVLLKRRDYTQALALLDNALAKNPGESDFLAMRGWLLHLMHTGADAPFDEILRCLDAALSAHIRNDRAHYYRGVVLKRLQRLDEAARHFRSAAEINPRNVDAVREVRLADMRTAKASSKPPPASGSGNLLSKLFGSNKEQD